MTKSSKTPDFVFLQNEEIMRTHGIVGMDYAELVNMDIIPKDKDGLNKMLESAYRRGYQQGADICLRSVIDKTPLSTLKKWLSAVGDWRFGLGEYKGKRNDRACWPPKPPMGN